MRKLALLSALGLVGALAGEARAAEYTVGAGSSCTHHAIADALQAAAQTPEADTIRLANDQAYADQIVDIGTSVTLIGGHGDCSDADPSGRTAIDGVGTWAAITVFGGDPNSSIEVRLERLDVSGGGASDIGYFGGIAVDGRSLVYLADVALHDNVGYAGGGLGVYGQNAIVTLVRNVEIFGNRATFGGGAYVEAGTLRVRPQSVSIHDNHAFDGGGLRISGGLVSVGSDPDDAGTPIDGFRIENNVADGNGGGVYVSGTWGSLLADDTIVAGNRAEEGGGVFAADDGYAQFARNTMGPYRHCPAELECLRISDNLAIRGGALALRSSAVGHVAETIVRGNSAVAGPAFAVHGADTELRTFGSVVARNPCTSVAPDCETVAMTGGRVRFNYMTFADNAGGDKLILVTGEDGARNAEVQMYSTLVSGKASLYDFNGTSLDLHLDCVIKDEDFMETLAERSEVAPIEFRNATAGDYRLAPGNRAIDYCDAANAPVEDPDRNGTWRGEDDPTAVDNFGSYDLGAYEYVEIPEPDDRLFANGFDLM